MAAREYAMIYDELNRLGIGYDTGRDDFDSSKPTLVMIHGAGGCSLNWQNQTSPLKDSLNTLALDLPGHGQTKGPAMNSIEQYAHWLGHLLETQFPDPVYLMGHSMGGAIAQETALNQGKSLKGIILAATGPILKVAPFLLEGFDKNFEETVDMLSGFLYTANADKNLVKDTAKIIKEQGAKTVLGDFSACDLFDRRNDISEISMPCLIICGEEDKLTPPSLSKKIKERIEKSRLVVLPSAGHMVMMETPDLFNQSVLPFLKDN
jgi:pimeloyl-ACP methyl ester carboxylesterase